MASHKHRFNAVVEKPALTTRHNFALPHSCDCTSIRLEQLENRRCSLSSESQQINPATSEVLENQPASWYQSQCPSHQHTPRRPVEPKGGPVYSATRHHRNHRHHQHHTHSHRKRIVLVKNSNPSIQKTILVHCRPVHSLSVFINDVSELMQCHIRNLYTLDGCKVDSVQSLLHGPSILVCVGQEPFHPFLLNIFQRNSEDKLPKLILKTQSSTCNKDQLYKKNVNFGLLSKKDLPPGPFPETRKNMQDDVENRVLVNKDGSLSVEMKVRFRLINDESLQCSTKIKKRTLCGHSESCSEAESLSASETEDICVSKLPSQRNSDLPHYQHFCPHCQEYEIWKCLRHIQSPSLNVASHKRKCKKESFDSVHNTSCEEYTEQVVEKATRIQHTVEGDSTVQYCNISRCSSRSEVCSVSTKTAGSTDDKDGKNKSPHAFGDRHKNLVFSKNFKQDLMSVQMTQVSIEDERPLSVETNSSDILASLKEDEDKEENELSMFLINSRASQSYKENDKQTCSTQISLCSFLPCKAPESPNDLSTRTTPKSPEAKNKPEEGVDVSYNREEGSAMSPKSNDSARSCLSRLSKVKCKERKNAELQKGESIMSVYTHASTILKQLTVSELLTNESGDQTEELMIHALSNSSRSLQISDLDLSELGEIENQRECSSPSIMSVKSNISEAIPVKFVKVHSAESISALSTKTNISVQSMTSELSEVAPEVMDKRLLIERVQSTMSLNSNISVSSKSSNILDNNPSDSEAVEESRGGQTQGANSKKTNNLLGLNTPKISTVGTKEADVLHEEKLKRPSSGLSSKSNTSVKSTKSKLRDEKDNSTTEKTEQLQDKCISSVKPSNHMDSELSKNCKTSEDMLEESGNFEANFEEQAPQSRSTKLISPRQSEELKTGTKGKKERALSATSSDAIKSRKYKISAQECDHPEERPASIMPNISVKSRKSVVSNAPCKHEEEEIKQACRRSQNALSVRSHKSRKSRRASRQDTGDKDNRERIPSVMSCKSSLSDRSIHVPNEVDNPTEDLLKQTESAYENIKDDRAASALSLKSQMSSLSIRSKDLSQERAATSMSAKSNLSTKSSTNLKKVLASHVSNTSAINANEYLADVSPAEVEHQSTERNLSAMSGKSNLSEKSKKNFKELMNLNEERLVERSPSAMTEKSTTKYRSKSSKAQSMENIPKSSTSAKNETLNCSIISNYSPNGDAVKSEEIWDIKESAPSDVTIKSVKSNISSLAGIDGLMKKVTNNEIKERASSALSNNSNISSVHHMPGSILTPASPSVSIGIVEEYDDNDEEDNSVSFLSETYIQTTDGRSNSLLTEGTIVSDTFKKSECNHKYLSQLVTDNEVANNTTAKKNSKESSSRSLSSLRSAHSDVGSSKTKDPPELTDKPINNTSLYLNIHGQKSNAIAKCKVAGKPSKSNLSNLTDRSCEKMSRPHSEDSVLKQKSKEPVFSLGFCNNRSPSNENGKNWNRNKDLNICGRTCNGSLVATDPIRNISDNKSEKNSISSCRHSTSSLAQKRDNNSLELVPSILPSLSATEVVNEWLKKIPLDLYNVEDEFHLNSEEGELLAGKVTHYEEGNGSEGASGAAMHTPENEQIEDILNNESKLQKKELSAVENIQPCTFPDASSVHLMKILLRPKLERCNSLPEVSPAYGRKLNMSAKEFLDNLVHLQLLGFDTNTENGKVEKYNVLMNMLQSLWLCDHHDSVTITQRGKFNNHQTKNEEFNVQSFSEIPINSSFQNSEKNSINGNTLSQTSTQGEGCVVLTRKQETGKTGNWIETVSNSATPDIASRVQWTPENETEENIKKSNAVSVVSDFEIRNDYSLREPTETSSISNKSSGTDSNINQKLNNHEEDTHIESSEKMCPLVEDPDSVWVLNLLNNIEKQFMTHYVTAMAEFKVCWNLNNNEQLDIMLDKLKDEVHRKIQASINNELRKIQCHARRPRPPKESMSRESSNSIEQRRRCLKVNLSESIDPATTAKIIEKDKEKISADLPEGKGSVEGESKEHAIEESMTVEAGAVEQEEAGRESTDEKGTKAETTDNKMGEETVTNKKILKDVSVGEETNEDNQTAEEVPADSVTESELEEAGKISDDEKEKHENTTTDAESSDREDEINEEAEKSESTDSEEKVTFESAGKDIKNIYKESAKDDYSFKEKIDKLAENGDKTDQESAEKDNPINNELAKERETDNDELDVERNTIKARTTEDEESAEYRENLYDESSDRTEIIKVKTGETVVVKMADFEKMNEAEATTNDDEVAGDDGAYNTAKSETAKDRDYEMSEIEEPTHNKTVDSGTKAKTKEHEETYDDKTSNEKGTAGSVVEKDEDIAEAAGENEKDDDDDDDDDGTLRAKEIVDKLIVDKTADDETADDGENPNDNTTDVTADDKKPPRSDLEEIVETTGVETAENAEEQGDNRRTDGQISDDAIADDEATTETKNAAETAEAKTGEDRDIANNGTIEGKDRVDNGTTEDGDKADKGTSEDGDTAENGTTEDGDTAENGTEDGDTADNGTSEDGDTADNGTSEDGDTADNGTSEDGDIAENRTTEDGDTADNGTSEDGDTADYGTSEVGDTADERETNDEELSEQEIVQNEEIDKATTEDCNKCLVTDREVNGESNESNTDEDGFYTHNINIKPDSEMLCVNVNAPSINSGKSAQGEAEAEEETEPIVETNGRVQGIEMPAMQPTEWSLHKTDIKMNSTVKMYPSSEDGADADSEDSDTELPNIYSRK